MLQEDTDLNRPTAIWNHKHHTRQSINLYACFLPFIFLSPKSHWLEMEANENPISNCYSTAVCLTEDSDVLITLSPSWPPFLPLTAWKPPSTYGKQEQNPLETEKWKRRKAKGSSSHLKLLWTNLALIRVLSDTVQKQRGLFGNMILSEFNAHQRRLPYNLCMISCSSFASFQGPCVGQGMSGMSLIQNCLLFLRPGNIKSYTLWKWTLLIRE